MDAASAREYFWGCTLTEEKPSAEWTFEEEDEDRDFFSHTLFLKSAVLGAGAKTGDVNLIEVETKNFKDTEIKQPIASLTAGQNNMCLLDISFDHRVPVKFTLKTGAGPVSIAAQHLVEFPDESDEFGADETGTEQEDTEVDEEEVAALESSKKRKASQALKNGVKSKRGKMEDDKDESMEADEDDEEDEEDDEEDMSEDDEDMSEYDEEEVESSPDVKRSTMYITITVEPAKRDISFSSICRKAKKGKNVKNGPTKAVKGKKNEATKKGKASPAVKKGGKKLKGK
ncbi:nucleoplasmin-like protein ANO39 isoform X1 [Lineus longissimus]|uniref:nucleoplasmin-like protein ANO39 isoform X1 n=1 Tax=Lineus longissimus TaxID=88925 RepID=UPI00315C7FA0